MSNEELERKMEFIIDQQTQSTAKIGVLEDIVTRLGNATLRRVEDLDDKMSVLVDSQIRLTEAQERTNCQLDDVDGKINAMVDSQIRLTESQTLTDEKLRSLIDHVDRYLSGNGRGGHQ